jgi:hypothetical protein
VIWYNWWPLDFCHLCLTRHQHRRAQEPLLILPELAGGLRKSGYREDTKAGPTIHPLLAEYARTVSAPDTEETLPALTNALATLARQANDLMDQSGSPSHFAAPAPRAPGGCDC